MPRRNLLACLCVGVVSLLCWQNSQGAKPKDEMLELYGTFVDAVEQVQANYVRPVSRKELLESALKGMLADLDPHSSYFNESDWSRFQKEIEGNFTGIGIRIEYDRKAGRPVVVAPMVNSPAYAAGILAERPDPRSQRRIDRELDPRRHRREALRPARHRGQAERPPHDHRQDRDAHCHPRRDRAG